MTFDVHVVHHYRGRFLPHAERRHLRRHFLLVPPCCHAMTEVVEPEAFYADGSACSFLGRHPADESCAICADLESKATGRDAGQEN